MPCKISDLDPVIGYALVDNQQEKYSPRLVGYQQERDDLRRLGRGPTGFSAAKQGERCLFKKGRAHLVFSPRRDSENARKTGQDWHSISKQRNFSLQDTKRFVMLMSSRRTNDRSGNPQTDQIGA